MGLGPSSADLALNNHPDAYLEGHDLVSRLR